MHAKLSKKGAVWFYSAVLCPKDANGIVNSVDPDQTWVHFQGKELCLL